MGVPTCAIIVQWSGAPLKAADHPNIISLYELFEDDTNVYMVMELCEGGNIKAYCAKNLRKSEAWAS
eukprot:2238385-Amphidinium_carterae.1